MSLCGDCPYPRERKLDEENDDELSCINGCDLETAAYRACWSYWQLNQRYKELIAKYEALVKKTDGLLDDGK